MNVGLAAEVPLQPQAVLVADVFVPVIILLLDPHSIIYLPFTFFSQLLNKSFRRQQEGNTPLCSLLGKKDLNAAQLCKHASDAFWENPACLNSLLPDESRDKSSSRRAAEVEIRIRYERLFNSFATTVKSTNESGNQRSHHNQLFIN